MFPGMPELMLIAVIIGGFIAVTVILVRRDRRPKD